MDTHCHKNRPITALKTVWKQVHQHSTWETNHGVEKAERWNGRHRPGIPEFYIITLISSLISASVHSFVLIRWLDKVIEKGFFWQRSKKKIAEGPAKKMNAIQAATQTLESIKSAIGSTRRSEVKSLFSLSPTQSTRALSGPLGIYSTEGTWGAKSAGRPRRYCSRPGGTRNKPQGKVAPAAQSTDLHSPGQAGDAESPSEPSRRLRFPSPMASDRSKEGMRRSSPTPSQRTSSPTLPQLGIQRTMIPARVWLRPPANLPMEQHCRSFRSAIYREGCGLWRRQRRVE